VGGGGQAHGREFKGLASRHCEARRAVAVCGSPRFARDDAIRHCEAIINVTARSAGPWQSQFSHLNEYLDGI
jgi:hypothetical protein